MIPTQADSYWHMDNSYLIMASVFLGLQLPSMVWKQQGRCYRHLLSLVLIKSHIYSNNPPFPIYRQKPCYHLSIKLRWSRSRWYCKGKSFHAISWTYIWWVHRCSADWSCPAWCRSSRGGTRGTSCAWSPGGGKGRRLGGSASHSPWGCWPACPPDPWRMPPQPGSVCRVTWKMGETVMYDAETSALLIPDLICSTKSSPITSSHPFTPHMAHSLIHIT